MLSPGTRLGPYEILSAAGAGGMGQVYRARDTRLDRTVAVKVLAADLAGRADVLQRFEREARAISALNHPNICRLYDVGSDNGTSYLVMEYVEGETLQERLTRGPLPIAEVWAVAIQIGDALDQAHRHGIVHRDLKPGNIMLSGPKRTVKLLDFGLAKLYRLPATGAPETLTSLPTVAQTVTTEGSIVGTMQYMAPEQLEGAEADHRADIFAFGCVLFEMVTGRRAFEGKSLAALISAIMTAEPVPVQSLQPDAPPALERLIRQCLAKEPDDRWQTAADLVREIKWISQAGSQAGITPAVRARRRVRLRIAWIAVTALSIALAVLLALHLREERPERPVVRFVVSPPRNYAFRWSDIPVLSPDGTRLVFGAETSSESTLFLRSRDTLEIRPVATAEPQNAWFPFWSPDGRYVAYFVRGKLNKIDLMGGPPVTLAEQRGVGGTWNREGTILYGTVAGPLRRVGAGGGTPVEVTKLDTAKGESSHLWPSFLPDGRHFLFTAYAAQPENRGVYVGSLDSPAVTRVLNDAANAQYSAPGYLLFTRADTLMAQPFDAQGLRTTDDPFPVAELVVPLGSLVGYPLPGSSFSVAAGSLAYRIGNVAAETELIWIDRQGNHSLPITGHAEYSNPALSPDGRTLAVGKRDPVTK